MPTIPKNPKDLWAWLHTHEGRKILRFTSVSAIATATSNIVLILVRQLHLIEGAIWSTIFSNFVATFPSYWLNRTWTWGKRGRSHVRKEILPFWMMSALGIAFSIVGATLARHVIKSHNVPYVAATALLVFANLASFGIFWILKLKLFNRIFHVDELEEMDEHLTAEEHAAEEHATEASEG
jgi:putative flippase GtrA